MKNGQGFLLVFSITSPSSLSELHGLREEILRIKDREDVPLVIVGNKADLEDQRQVARTKAFGISQQWGAPYYEASARTRSKLMLLLGGNLARADPENFLANVDEVFIDICRQMLRADDAMEAADDMDDNRYRSDDRNRRRRRRRRKDHPHCVIL